MELLNDLEKACNIVRAGETRKERDNAVRALLYGTVDVDTNGAPQLLHRRALFITMLREKKIWEYPKEPREDPPDELGEQVYV